MGYPLPWRVAQESVSVYFVKHSNEMGTDGGRFFSLLNINQIVPQTQQDAHHTTPDETHAGAVLILFTNSST